MSKHTWYEAKAGEQGLVCSEDTGETIAVVYNKTHTALIAAAPEMLESLRIIASQSTGPDWTPEQALIFIKKLAKTTIARATGGPTS